MGAPLVSCLMATHGRVRWVEETLACFLEQDYPTRELVILNNHSVPLIFDHPLVRVANEPRYPTLGHCRNRLLTLARGELVRTWDDDDLYLPWSISQGVEHLGDAAAFKPQRSWCSEGGPQHWQLESNVFEAAMLVRTDVARRYGYQETGGDEHQPLLAGLRELGAPRRLELGCLTGYVYRWGWGNWHISGSLGTSTLERRTAAWRARNDDAGDGVAALCPAYDRVRGYWDALLASVAPRYGAAEAEGLRRAFEAARLGAQR
jgi:glycosyltransferase involved in cell wall biosynthesis